MMKNKLSILALCVAVALSAGAAEPDTLTWTASATGGGATGNFAPYLVGSNSGQRHAMNGVAEISGLVVKDFNLSRRFSWSAGAEVAAGWQGSADYARYDATTATWTTNSWHPARAYVQQAWAGVKYRGAFLTVGMRDHVSPTVDDRLSSGDLTLSNNARAIPQVEAGFVDFQNIPFTKGWVQIAGALSYGKYTDNDALRAQYNYYGLHINVGQYFTYKRAHFRTRPDQPLMVTIGTQAAGEFGGTATWYYNGKPGQVVKHPTNFKAFWEMFIPKKGNGDGFVEGNHLGTWDLKARYRLRSGIELEGYFEWLWEDGSSMARRNCTDGLWGVRVTLPGERRAVKTVLVEYVDFRDQSGPMHWAPADAPGTTITTEASGGDNYYNSTGYNAWANYGMSLGSPFLVAPIYNLDGYPQFLHSRSRGVHAAATGCIGHYVDWTAKVSHAVAWGNGRTPDARALKNTSAMLTVGYDARALIAPGFSASCTLGFDAGSLRGNNFGALATIAYTGHLAF